METSITTTAPASAPARADANADANAAVAVLDPGRVEDGSHAEPLDVEMSYLELFLAASGDVSTVNDLASESLLLSDNKGQCEPAERSDSTTRTAASTTSTSGRKRRIPTATEGSSSDGTHATPAPKTKARVSYSTLQKVYHSMTPSYHVPRRVAFINDLLLSILLAIGRERAAPEGDQVFGSAGRVFTRSPGKLNRCLHRRAREARERDAGERSAQPPIRVGGCAVGAFAPLGKLPTCVWSSILESVPLRESADSTFRVHSSADFPAMSL